MNAFCLQISLVDMNCEINKNNKQTNKKLLHIKCSFKAIESKNFLNSTSNRMQILLEAIGFVMTVERNCVERLKTKKVHTHFTELLNAFQAFLKWFSCHKSPFGSFISAPFPIISPRCHPLGKKVCNSYANFISFSSSAVATKNAYAFNAS